MSDQDIRGVYMTACEVCGCKRACRLAMVGNRYLWKCIGNCITAAAKADLVAAFVKAAT